MGWLPEWQLKRMGKDIFLLPGPPHEMGPMFEKEALPYLLGTSGKREVIVSRVLKFYGIGEAELEFRVQSILEKQTNPTVAPLGITRFCRFTIDGKSGFD